MEQWLPIRDFPTYSISDWGNVKNEETGRVMMLYTNQRDILCVGMMLDGVQHKRAVDLLVAEEFMGPHENPHFTSVIHLDGNLHNNYVENLMWRPLWFRVRFHKHYGRRDQPRVLVPIYVVDTDEVFANSHEMAMKYGLMEKDIAMAINNFTNLWPMNYQVRYYRD